MKQQQKKNIDETGRITVPGVAYLTLQNTQYMLDQLVDLQNREHLLVEANRSLRKKLDESNNAQVPLRQAWEAGGQSIQYSQLPPQSEGFCQPLGGNSTLHIGYNPVASEEMNVGAPAQNVHGFIPGWML